MSRIDRCPFRTYSEVRLALMQGQGNIMVTGFMECLKDKCPAFYVEEKYLPNTGGLTERVEGCKRLGG